MKAEPGILLNTLAYPWLVVVQPPNPPFHLNTNPKLELSIFAAQPLAR